MTYISIATSSPYRLMVYYLVEGDDASNIAPTEMLDMVVDNDEFKESNGLVKQFMKKCERRRDSLQDQVVPYTHITLN